MDPQLLGTGGITLFATVIIGYLLRQNYADRRQYQQHIAEVQAGTIAMQKRTAEAIAESDARSASQIAALRTRISTLEEQLDKERNGRWAAEDESAEYRRRYEALLPPGGTT